MLKRQAIVSATAPTSAAVRGSLVLLGAVLSAACAAESGPASRQGPSANVAGSAAAATNGTVIAGPSSTTPSDAPTLIPVSDAAAPVSGPPLENCDPGAYSGTYACKLVMQGMPTDTPIEGVVSFYLEVNSVETKQNCPPGAEFCDFDLVIKEGSGELFGFVLGFVGFQTGLQGGLDCRSGKFHADAVGGIYGVPWQDPDDPEKLRVEVPIGTFDGTLDGFHGGKIPQVIAGEWNLGEPSFDIYCPGPFSVELMP